MLIRLLLAVLIVCLLTSACGQPFQPVVQASTALPSPSETAPVTLAPLPSPGATPTPSVRRLLMPQSKPGEGGQPTWADFWTGRAKFVVEVQNTGLPMGESDTIVMSNGEFWSYMHASLRSAGTVDRCGDPVEFPGCTVIYRSRDGGRTFYHDEPPVCQFECRQCPCDSAHDHIDQQQYPRVFTDGSTLSLVYEYRGRVMLRRSNDGLTWSPPEQVRSTGVWVGQRTCRREERIGPHPYAPHIYDCLVGGPPGLYLEGRRLYVFVGLGQNPGSMGCYYGTLNMSAGQFVKCGHNPLFTGAAKYGPLKENGSTTRPFFDFRTISSAKVQKIGDRYYMLYEGTRGPGEGDPGDSQFGLGLARSLTNQIDGPWEKFPGNPILVDPPGNIGVGHADVVVANGQTLLYTSLDGIVRSRLALGWK